MTSDRPYRKAMPLEEARMEIQNEVGTQFCPAWWRLDAHPRSSAELGKLLAGATPRARAELAAN